ncbi:MAG: 3D-(3,5/4)-trihydroxycyclohexane-1,2-dione acylhydrolase (decyclizing) [Oligoflexia bacterium]|nr:3D-(3,5/4)-trihydroxycyclohexane-1,2-dione acylhydrolase (decyclizing) [Oligoflexia bacterium]
MKTKRLTVAAAIVEFLKNQYVSRDGQEHRLINGMMGIFGHGNVAGLGQALEEHGHGDLPFIQPKNEQAMVHTAIAYAKARRGLGTFGCTTSVGPGATNLVTGAATATINRLPVLLLPGDIFANRRPAPVLQQLEHNQSYDVSVNDCLKPVSRFWDRINRPEQLLVSLPEAMRVLSDPSLQGAVTICLPEDVQVEAYDWPVHFFEKRVYQQTRRTPEVNELGLAMELIKTSKRPLLIAGGGVIYSEAEQALRKFAETTHIPVAVTQAGKGALADSFAYCLGAVGTTGTFAANLIARDADLVIGVGTRFSDFTTASKTQFQNPAVRFLTINLSSFDAYKNGAQPIVADARLGLEKLGEALGNHRVDLEYDREIMAAREEWIKKYWEIVQPKSKPKGAEGKLVQSEVIRIVNECLDESSTIVHAAGSLPGDLHKLWMSRSSKDYHSEYGYSCMGYEIAGAMGVKMAASQREVYAFLGDGSYLMMNHEIVTSIQEGHKITILLVDNHGYQCIHNLQRSCGGASFGNEFRHRDAEKNRLEGPLVEIDYIGNAKSLGVITFRATDERSLKAALEGAKRELTTCLIYIPVDLSLGVPGFSWWDVPVSEVSENPSVVRARLQYQEAITRQRFLY